MPSPRLHFPRQERRSDSDGAQLPLSPSAEAIRDNLAERRQQLGEIEPASLVVTAQILAALHEHLRGMISDLRGTHSPEYRRRQLLGRDGLPLEDLVYLALHAPGAVASALQPLARLASHQLEPLEPDVSMSVTRELARLTREFGLVSSGIIARLEDGLTAQEACECDNLLHKLKNSVLLLEAALHTEALGGKR